MASLHISGDPEADDLVSSDPLALLVAMVLDQQVPLEWAFSAPLRLASRLGGGLDADRIAAMDPDELGRVFAERPALHRFPGANAKRVQQLCRLIVDDYGGDPAAIWETATSGDELYRRVRALPGFGEQKARIFVGLLGKQLDVRPPGWEEAAGGFGHPGTYLSVADIVDQDSLARVRSYKQEKKAAARAEAGTDAAPPPRAGSRARASRR